MDLLHLECYPENYIPILQNILINYLREKLKNTKVTTLEDIKGFDYDDYIYSKEHTLKENQPVFIR